MATLVFHPINGDPKPAIGIAYRRRPKDQTYLRFTHIFPDCYYVMEVSTDVAARKARRPYRLSRDAFESIRRSDGKSGGFGHLDLPESMRWQPEKDTVELLAKDIRVRAIAPLVHLFNTERNLGRSTFDSSIRNRANEVEAGYDTVKRDLLRYYYFGLDDRALVPLPSGPKPNAERPIQVIGNDGKLRPRLRPGRAPIESPQFAKSTFTPDAKDIEELRRAVREKRRLMPTARLEACRDHYVETYFKKSHPDLYKELVDKVSADHVTVRMMSYYMTGQDITEDEKRNVSKAAAAKHNTGAVRSGGPGTKYEADATGGRLIIVSEQKQEDEPIIELGQPMLYFVIDRWSRFVVSAYITLGTNSAEELKHSLMLAFAPREATLKRFGVIASEESWPRGQVCSVLITDRGSDYISEEAGKLVADSLRIHHQVLPAVCPEKKAIIERFNRTIKDRLSEQLNRKGAYAKRPLDPHTRKAFRKAKADAQVTLKAAWGALIEAVDWYNNKPHRALEKKGDLVRVRISTPKEAYAWGLVAFTGKQPPRHSEDEMYQMLLDSRTATLKRNMLVYEANGYVPADDLARLEAAKAPYRGGWPVSVRVDSLTNVDLYMKVGQHGRTAHFTATQKTLDTLGSLAVEERKLLGPLAKKAAKITKINQQRDRIKKAESSPRSAQRKGVPIQVDADRKRQLRAGATSDIKQAMNPLRKSSSNQPQNASPTVAKPGAPKTPTREDREAARLQASRERVRNAMKGK